MTPYYVPAGYWTYNVLVLGSWVADLFRGESGWWIVTNSMYKRFNDLRSAEACIDRIAQRLDERIDVSENMIVSESKSGA